MSIILFLSIFVMQYHIQDHELNEEHMIALATKVLIFFMRSNAAEVTTNLSLSSDFAKPSPQFVLFIKKIEIIFRDHILTTFGGESDSKNS